MCQQASPQSSVKTQPYRASRNTALLNCLFQAGIVSRSGGLQVLASAHKLSRMVQSASKLRHQLKDLTRAYERVAWMMSCRWTKKRMRRYSHIDSEFCSSTMYERRGTKENASWTVPPLLPSLLMACGPSAQLSLSVLGYRGGKPPVGIGLDWRSDPCKDPLSL